MGDFGRVVMNIIHKGSIVTAAPFLFHVAVMAASTGPHDAAWCHCVCDASIAVGDEGRGQGAIVV